MRLVYTLFTMLLWAIIMSQFQGVSPDIQCLSLAIVIAGALAGGDGK